MNHGGKKEKALFVCERNARTLPDGGRLPECMVRGPVPRIQRGNITFGHQSPDHQGYEGVRNRRIAPDIQVP